MSGFHKTREEWKEAFDKYADRNHDGKVECWEMKKFLQVMGMNPTDKEVEEKLFNDFHKTKEDTIDFEEFYVWVQKQQDPLNEMYEAFRTFDKNQNGHIDKDELAKIMSSITDEDELKEFFELVDADGNGLIDYSEFCAVFCDQSEPQQAN